MGLHLLLLVSSTVCNLDTMVAEAKSLNRQELRFGSLSIEVSGRHHLPRLESGDKFFWVYGLKSCKEHEAISGVRKKCAQDFGAGEWVNLSNEFLSF